MTTSNDVILERYYAAQLKMVEDAMQCGFNSRMCQYKTVPNTFILAAERDVEHEVMKARHSILQDKLQEVRIRKSKAFVQDKLQEARSSRENSFIR